MQFLKFFYGSKWRIALTALSFMAFIDTWSRFKFGHTRDMGAGAVFLYSLSYGYGGAVIGVVIASVPALIQKLRGKIWKLSDTTINVVWSIAMLAWFGRVYRDFLHLLQ